MPSIIVGFPSSIPRRRASAVAAYTARMSLPSTRIEGRPYATPRGAMPSLRYWSSVRVEIA
jgi:hypothetical protein